MRRREPIIQRYQEIRDELRTLLLGYFEYREHLQDAASDKCLLSNVQGNFEALKQRLKEFWVLHDHLGDFIPGLVDDVGLNQSRHALRAAKQYLLLLLPETPSVPDADDDPGHRGNYREVGQKPGSILPGVAARQLNYLGNGLGRKG